MTNALTLLRQWSDLPAPSLDDLVGTWRAEFVPPLRHIAPVGLGLIGLPRWYGKRFEWDGPQGLIGTNLIRTRDGSDGEERLIMRVTLGRSTRDGLPVAVVTYATDAAPPWRWIRDELRGIGGGSVVGLSYVYAPAVRTLGLPFLLHSR